MRRIAILVLIPLLLSACANKGLRDLRTNGDGPDEFMIQPSNPLETPTDLNTLPAPKPGQANRTDRSALNEGVIAFGGRPEAANGPVPASDGALIAHASRRGVQPNIRTTLAEEDAKFRKRKGRLTQIRIVSVDRYNQAYKKYRLDAGDEAARWRRAGRARHRHRLQQSPGSDRPTRQSATLKPYKFVR